ncbi:MAG: methionine synthase [Alphaproteobacteria bacterium]|nr:methionine synthase [Alphaproteobacteria bacterium]
MKLSESRILTTHAGSLPRVQGLADLLVTQEEGQPIEPEAFEAALQNALDDVVQHQIAAGIDIGNDGEMPRPSFVSYIAGRMSGFGRGGPVERPLPLDAQNFPIWFEQMQRSGRRRLNVYQFPQAIGEVGYDDTTAVEKECDDLLACLAKRGGGFAEGFMTAVSPGFAATAMINQHYDSHEAYVFALARGLRKEYEAIVAKGFVLQIDAPDMGMERAGYFQDASLSEFQSAIEMHIAALNEALENVPAEMVRLHACWGNRDGPHVHDVPVADVLAIMYQANVGAITLPFANPRHSHEIEIFREQPLPDGMALVPGVIETTCNYVEHPLTVAERLCRAVDCVGDRERVIAGTDCGFGTIAGDTFTAEDVVWAKLESLRQGADIASERLWG